MLPNGVRRSTRTDEIKGRIQHDILSGSLRPGQRLKFPDLAERYDASVGVLREALAKLMDHGLVRSAPHLGFRVTPVTQAGFEELNEARTEIEIFVLRRAIADGDLDWESRVIAAHHRFERTPRRADGGDDSAPDDAWITAHADFHNTVLDGCANRRMLRIAAGLRDETEFYRVWTTPREAGPIESVVRAKHQALRDAAIARDVDGAERIARELIGYSSHLGIDPELEARLSSQ